MTDFKKLVTEKRQLLELSDEFLPKHLKPKALVGFKGIDLVSEKYMNENVLNDDKFIIYAMRSKFLSVVDIGAMFDVVYSMQGLENPDEQNEDNLVLFITENLPEHTVIFLLFCGVFLVQAAGIHGTKYTSSRKAISESMQFASELMNSVFGERAYGLVLAAKQFLKKS